MQYFKNLLASFFDPQVYQRFIKAPSKKAFGHFIISMVLVGIAQGLYLGLVQLPKFQERAAASLEKITALYPSDLQITWDGERLTTQPEKYHQLRLQLDQLPLFEGLPTPTVEGQTLLYYNDNLSTVEARELLREEGAATLVDQESAFFMSEEAGLQEFLLRDYLESSDSFTLEEETIPVIEDFILEGFRTIERVVFWFLPLAITLFLVLTRILVALVFATLIYFPARLGKSIRTWQHSWRFTLVLLVVVEVLSQATVLLYPNLNFPVYSVAFWLLSLFILLALQAPKSSKAKRK